MGGIAATASTPKDSAWAASSLESRVLLQATWAIMVSLPWEAAAHVDALDPLIYKVFGQGPDPLGGDLAVFVIAGIECGDNALVLGNVFHGRYLLSNCFLLAVSEIPEEEDDEPRRPDDSG